MNWETMIDWFLKFAGVVDSMFFLAYLVGNVIDWFKNRRG